MGPLSDRRASALTAHAGVGLLPLGRASVAVAGRRGVDHASGHAYVSRLVVRRLIVCERGGMRQHRLWSGLTCLGVLALAFGPTAGHAASVAVVTDAVQVTNNPVPVRAHSSPVLARNPKDGELAIVETDIRGTRACNVHLSFDDGRSWTAGGDIMTKPYTDCALYGEYGPYAGIVFDKNGVLLVSFVASEFTDLVREQVPRNVFLARSVDGGRTFDTTMVFKAPSGNQDKGHDKGATVAVDPTNPDHVYVGWRQGVSTSTTEKLKSDIAASSDGGKTFGPPVDVADQNGGDYPEPVVGLDGTVHVIYWGRFFPPPPSDPARPVRPINYVRSTDHGKTFSEPEPVDPGNQSTGDPRPPVVAVDPTNSSTIYMVWWSDSDPMNAATGFQGNLDIFFRRSTDNGKTWSDRKTINDDTSRTPKANHFDPGISVAPNGRIDVAWLDGRLSSVPPAGGTGTNEKGFQDVYYSSSTDRGDTWAPNIRVTDRSIDRSIGVWSNSSIGSHHNLGVASTDGKVFITWQDSRNGNSLTGAEDVYFSSVNLDGTAQAKTKGKGVARGLVFAVGSLLGLGGATALAAGLARRSANTG